MVHIVDWFPTLLSLAGHQLTSETDGVDIWRTLTEDRELRSSFVYNSSSLSKSGKLLIY